MWLLYDEYSKGIEGSIYKLKKINQRWLLYGMGEKVVFNEVMTFH